VRDVLQGTARLVPDRTVRVTPPDGEERELVTRGVRPVLGASAVEVRRIDNRLTVALSTGAALAGDAVLFAASRTPNTEGLGLEDAGVRLDAHRRIVVDRSRDLRGW
jgi:pyruvate/2-oxoglutarate dehydrogenase complex dihydrolipoamide dehydrogenase (E3) component